jgi:hypothetical protein
LRQAANALGERQGADGSSRTRHTEAAVECCLSLGKGSSSLWKCELDRLKNSSGLKHSSQSLQNCS